MGLMADIELKRATKFLLKEHIRTGGNKKQYARVIKLSSPETIKLVARKYGWK